MPPSIKLHQLDTTIIDAIRNIRGGPLPGVKGPIINGIILKDAALKGRSALSVAKQITASIPVGSGADLKPVAQSIGDGKWFVGFKIKSSL